MGSPQWPSDKQIRAMEGNARGPKLLKLSPYVNGTAVRLNLPLPSVALAQLCSRPSTLPSVPQAPKLLTVQGGNATVVLWTASAQGDSARVLQTYVIESSVDGGTYAKVMSNGLIATVWIDRHGLPHTKTTAPIKRCYRVSALDYWGTLSAPSSATCTT